MDEKTDLHPNGGQSIERQIEFVLSSPGMSDWLKRALESALARDPVATLNDLEILDLILRQRSERLIAERLAR